MGIFTRDGAALRTISSVYANDGGTLRNFLYGYINDAGTLRQSFRRGVPAVMFAGPYSPGTAFGSSSLSPYGASFVPDTFGPYRVYTFLYFAATGNTSFTAVPQVGTTPPPNDDTVFKQLRITGV